EDSNRVRLVQRVLHEVPPPPRQTDPRLPRDLETIVLKCLHKDPHDRYATAAALADDLRRFLADQPIQARRASWRERGWRWCRRNPAIAGLTAAVALLLVALSAGSIVVAVHLREQRDQALVNEQRAREAEDRAHRYFQLLEEQRTTLPDPGLVTAFRGQVGRTYHFRVRGSPFGTIWGTDVYPDDSGLPPAAVRP